MRLDRRTLRFVLAFVAGISVASCDDNRGADGGTDSGGNRDGSRPDGFVPPGCGSLTMPPLSYEFLSSPTGGWRDPVFLTQPAVGDTALYVVEQEGVIRRVDGTAVSTFLDITTRVDFGGMFGRGDERGLLGLAFHPTDPNRFFVYYTATEGGYRNIVAEYRRSAGDPLVADSTEIARLIDVDDPDSNHNGGMIAFGPAPDHFLYVGMGDGGYLNDKGHGTIGNAQNLNSPLGKIHRLNVDNSPTYAAAGNPGLGGVPTIWAYGLRNPWRFSFDRLTRDLYIGDVGQDAYEEIDIQPASSSGGENYGWAAFEGYARLDRFTEPDVPLDDADHTPPAIVYAHIGDDGDILPGSVGAVIGGYVYRGSAIPEMQGWYLFGDYTNFGIAAVRWCDGTIAGGQLVRDLDGPVNPFYSFGEDQAGELYLLGGGGIVRICPDTGC